MKCRSGFVSNSSSSSFIIAPEIVRDNNLTTIKVAHQFLFTQELVIAEYNNKPTYVEVFNWLLENDKTDKNPIFQFPSCNYDTYVWKLSDGSIKINTCNNADWSSACNITGAIWTSYGSDDDDWPEIPMANQQSEWDEEYYYTYPDKSKIIVLKPNTKYDDLPVLNNPNPVEFNRFIALMEE